MMDVDIFLTAWKRLCQAIIQLLSYPSKELLVFVCKNCPEMETTTSQAQSQLPPNTSWELISTIYKIPEQQTQWRQVFFSIEQVCGFLLRSPHVRLQKHWRRWRWEMFLQRSAGERTASQSFFGLEDPIIWDGFNQPKTKSEFEGDLS